MASDRPCTRFKPSARPTREALPARDVNGTLLLTPTPQSADRPTTACRAPAGFAVLPALDRTRTVPLCEADRLAVREDIDIRPLSSSTLQHRCFCSDELVTRSLTRRHHAGRSCADQRSESEPGASFLPRSCSIAAPPVHLFLMQDGLLISFECVAAGVAAATYDAGLSQNDNITFTRVIEGRPDSDMVRPSA